MDVITPHLTLYSAFFLSTTPSSPVSTSTLVPRPEVPVTTFLFTVQQEHTNRSSNLHGGCTATLFDYCTSVALYPIARTGRWQFLGVSRTLNCTYLRPVPCGTEILIECEVISVGKQLALIRGIMRHKLDGRILAVCEHNKVNNDPPSKL
ncbi:thioesterase superfamily protein [Colletotrichum incanum]|nr:thioesterase superfamily protein [Colletotrichum incanum]